ncbi:P-loop containing nucleoside triphosphate hydrolase protein, partial [Dioscorea alata]
MVSPVLSGIAGAILAPILPQFALNKLLDSLLEYLSRDQPSSSSHVDRLQQLENERKAFEEANLKLEILQDDVRRLHKRDKQNKRLILINNKLRDVSYQIKDLKDDLEYMELQRKVEEINLQDEPADKNPSTALQLFSSINPWQTGGSSDKRRRLSSSQSTDDIVNKMRTIIEQINCIHSEMRSEMKLDALKGGYDSCGQHQAAENKRVTTSSPSESKIYGRDNEQSRLIQVLLNDPNESGNVSVLPVVGMGGIGKTTLAQFVFNSTEIANHFEKKAWICVSDYFDRFRITKEILDSLCIGEGSSSTVTTSCDVLERKIKSLVIGKKFLLVLDDVWSDEWQELLNFLRCAQAKAIKLIVTCRDPRVLGGLADWQNQINLKGLSDEDIWSLFMKCAFADKIADNSPELHAIGKQIVGKLKGSPLAAKTVGRLLGSCLTEEHWKDILESDLWKLKTDEEGIMSALALSYYHLRQPLQLCFTFCSVFPKDFEYDMDSVIGMWIVHGYIQEIEGSSKTLEDTGEEYWLELEARGFIEKVYGCFKMHDLLHDLARSVSHGETYIYEGRKDEEIPKDVCHLFAHSFCDLELVCKTKSLCTLYLLKVLKLMRPPPTLPSRFHNLINLRRFHMHDYSYFTNYLRRFYSVIYQINSGGYQIAHLRNMNELTGKLLIGGLQNIGNTEEMIKAKYLKEKHHIKVLSLIWNNTSDDCKHDLQEQMLEALEPHSNLKYLGIYGYMGFKSPNWLMTPKFQRLEAIMLNGCRKWARLPAALGLLPSLKSLELLGIENMTIEDMEIDSCQDLETLPAWLPRLPLLNKLIIRVCPKFKSWGTKEEMTALPNLHYMEIDSCEDMETLPAWLPHLSSLNKLIITECPKIHLLPQNNLPSSLEKLHLIE